MSRSGQSEDTFLSYPDTNFHFLLLGAAALFISLLSSPMFYGNSSCSELFAGFSSIWKLRTNDPVTRELEWRRRMQLILEQLKTGSLLTRQYAMYHGIGLLLDWVTLLLVSLYTLHYFDWSLPTSYFAVTRTEDDVTTCHMPNKHLYQWFSLVSTFVMALKVTIRSNLILLFTSVFSRHLIVSFVLDLQLASQVFLVETWSFTLMR